MDMFAEIVVNAPLRRRRVPILNRTEGFSSLSQTFTYKIPLHLQGRLEPGHLVTVPFGARKLQGIVLALSEQTTVERLKDLYDLSEPKPALSLAQLALAQWMSGYYLAPLIECMEQMFPPGLEAEVETRIALNPDARPLVNAREAHQLIVDRLRRDGPMAQEELLSGDRKEDIKRAIDALVRRGVVVRHSELLPPRAREKRERSVMLVAEPSAEVMASLRAPRQKAVLDFLTEHGGLQVAIAAREVQAAAGADAATLKALAKNNLIRIVEHVIWRDPLKGRNYGRAVPPTLTPEQQQVWDAIQQNIVSGSPDTYLLFGVTGSGKTEIYLRAVSEALAQGRQAIVLVPEIALTPQTIRRFAERFPAQVTVTHSKISEGERYDQWRRIRAGEVGVVIGSRSAVFAPLPRLGLIVMDEEHEPTYKQEHSPFYHVRDVALRYAQLARAVVILGSATPSLESMSKAKRGEYRLLELTQRIAGAVATTQPAVSIADGSPMEPSGPSAPAFLRLPPVQIVDMRVELKAGNSSIFSLDLRHALTATLDAHEQAILFLNRRGTATFVMCRDCGFVLRCRRCDNPLTYHADQGDLVCHHCNRRYQQPMLCPNCASTRIKQFGAGTQRVEEMVRQLFPAARTLRWDRDVTGAKGAHEQILRQFTAHEADVLIGTQMIAKGLDLPMVTLVGVVSADTTLHLPDFRSSERTFQLLTQVAGRAGRSRYMGRVIFQTYTPDHPALLAAAEHNYAMFYTPEMEFRQRLNYPPYSQLIRLVIASSGRRIEQEAEAVHRRLQEHIRQIGASDLDLIGPA
ncbi:MAG: primosomal protein N', partial [Chloroflexi bacterium]|nr:primosomal protein N' [Chloroflexota bacterium]